MLLINYFVQINFEIDCFSTHTVTGAPLRVFGHTFNTLVDALEISSVITKLVSHKFLFWNM